jgi:tRNA C32,U32 (ribose-2'-O)-methylase TrmJ
LVIELLTFASGLLYARAGGVGLVRAAKAAGTWIAAVELTVDSVSPAAMQPRLPAVLVLGDERFGISPEVLTYADQTVAIPMLGMANSLNDATAGAIVLHKLVRALPSPAERIQAVSKAAVAHVAVKSRSALGYAHNRCVIR